MRCPVLIGRAVEVGSIADTLAAAAAGRGGAVVLSGEPGVGKSRLLDHGLDATACRVLRAAALVGERLDWAIAAAAAGADAPRGIDTLRNCADLDLVAVDGDQVRFRHALTRDVVVSDLLPLERQHLCRAVATAARHAMAAGLRRDLLIADLLVDAGEALETLVAGSAAAEAGSEVHHAEQAPARAFLLATDDFAAERPRVGRELLRLRLITGHHSAVIDLGDEILAQVEGRDRAAAAATRVLIARAHLARGEWSHAEARRGASGVGRTAPASKARRGARGSPSHDGPEQRSSGQAGTGLTALSARTTLETNAQSRHPSTLARRLQRPRPGVCRRGRGRDPRTGSTRARVDVDEFVVLDP